MSERASCCAKGRLGTIPVKEKENIIEKQLTSTVKFREKMQHINGATFLMGTNDKDGFIADGEGPVREVSVDDFLIDKTAVTNEEFQRFIDDTGYVTDAQKYGWSFVFHMFVSEETMKQIKYHVAETPWWLVIEGAAWNNPEGKDSHIYDRMDHPVVHISWNDAVAFSDWAGKRLPTEAEWEFAARGGLVQKKYPWGDELTPNGQHYCNIWQGEFPKTNDKEDGYIGTAPVNTFPANGYGLYNMAGNVWEWCTDQFTKQIVYEQHRVMRGGSYLCHHSYCNRYRVAARTSNTVDSSSGNIGFRCAVSI